jgi:hypothetical protein
MKRMSLWMMGCVCVATLAGCGDVDGAKDKVKDTGASARDKIAAKIEAELVDFLECDGGVKPSTIARVRELLRDPDELSLGDLVAAPEDVAELVGVAGLTVEAYVLLAKNFLLLFEQGHLTTLVEQGADGLTCGDTITLACTAGTGTTQVLCPAGQARTIRSSYTGCVLSGTRLDGVMTVAIPATDMTSALVSFDGLVLDEVTRVVGSAALDLDATKSAQTLAVQAMSGLQLISHGGSGGGKSCGETLTLERLELGNEPARARVGFKGSKASVDATYALETFGAEDLAWDKPFACACPRPGAGLLLSVPRPLGRAGQTASMRVTYGAAAAGSCAVAKVEMVDWPTDCSFLENPTSDCGKGAAQDVIAPLLTALCQPLPTP